MLENDLSLHWELEHTAELDVAKILRYLSASWGGDEAAHRFSDALDQALAQECMAVAEQITQTGVPSKRIHEQVSVYRSRPTFRLDVQTTKKRARRSGAGLWYVYYSIVDADADGVPDTLLVYAVEHSTAQPFAINTGQFDADAGDDGE